MASHECLLSHPPPLPLSLPLPLPLPPCHPPRHPPRWPQGQGDPPPLPLRVVLLPLPSLPPLGVVVVQQQALQPGLPLELGREELPPPLVVMHPLLTRS